MDVSPKTLREVEFREKMRGYHPEDVDQFLEQVAGGLEVIQDRLRQAVERAQRAEAAAADSGGANDDTLRRTLVLAQRTADMAVQEAREQAARILAGAEQQAQGMLADSEDRARRTHDDALGAIRTELAQMESTRQRAQAEIDAMYRWIDDHRMHLTSSLKDALSAVERAGAVAPPPTSTPIEVVRPITVPGAPAPGAQGPDLSGSAAGGPAASGSAAGSAAATGSAAPAPTGPSPVAKGMPGPASTGDRSADQALDTAAWTPPRDPGPTGEVAVVPVGRKPVIDVDAPSRPEDRASDAEEQALDDFFEDGEYADERRFGGRLRRRR